MAAHENLSYYPETESKITTLQLGLGHSETWVNIALLLYVACYMTCHGTDDMSYKRATLLISCGIVCYIVIYHVA